MIYEDVQRDTGALEAGNGWSSSEFESYDEHSDNEAKLPTKSKVEPVWMHPFPSLHKLSFLQIVNGIMTDQVVLVGFQQIEKKINVTISSGASAVQLSLLMYRTVRKL